MNQTRIKLRTLLSMSMADLRLMCACDDPEQHVCDACMVLGALEAGIPRSVIAGETKLTDHFSESYINFKCGRESDDETNN